MKELLQSRYIGNVLANHVSAKGLTSRDVPSLIEHKLLPKGDRIIWNSAYDEEYDSLIGLPAWITIDEDEYQRIKHKNGRPVPSLEVSPIKFDEDGNPKRAKYKIFVLVQYPNLCSG